MTSAMCVQCSYPTGLGMCLMRQGVLPRTCARCRVDLPTVWYDILCMPCAEAEGSDYMSIGQARKERSAYLRACEDCALPTYADGGPLCPICRVRREGFGFAVCGYPHTRAIVLHRSAYDIDGGNGLLGTHHSASGCSSWTAERGHAELSTRCIQLLA